MLLYTVFGLEKPTRSRRVYLGLSDKLTYVGKASFRKALYSKTKEGARELERAVIAQCGWVNTQVKSIDAGKSVYAVDLSSRGLLLFGGVSEEGTQLYVAPNSFSLFAERLEALRVDDICRAQGLKTNMRLIWPAS